MELDSNYRSNESGTNCQNVSRTTISTCKPQSSKGKGVCNGNGSITFTFGNKEDRIEVQDRQVLIQKSSFLKNLLTTNPVSEIRIAEWSLKVFKVFLDYVQTGVFKSGDLDQYGELLRLSVSYKEAKLTTQVCPLAKQNITLENCVEMYVLGATNELDDLRIAAFNFFLRMGNAFLEHQNFLELDCITLSILISSDDFPIVEITLFKRLKDWVTAQCKRLNYPADRKEFFGRVAGLLFSHVRYAQMTPKEFRNEVLNSGLVSQKEIDAVNLRHRTHPGLWYSLPPSPLIDRPRMTRLQFAVPLYNNVQVGFRKIPGASNIIQESVRFLVSHDIYLTSIGFFGPAKTDRSGTSSPLTAYTIKIHVEGDYSKHHWRIPAQKATVFTRDNFMIDLSHPFQIKRLQPYKLTVWIDGEVTQFGVFPLPQAIVLLQDKGELITFHFCDADSDPKPALETTGVPTSAAPILCSTPQNNHQQRQHLKQEPRISGVIRSISFILKD